MPYENPYLDSAGKTETFFRDILPFDAFTRGSADYAYEAKGISDALGGFNVGFITGQEDRQLFLDIYKDQVVREQMLYNNLAVQTNSQQAINQQDDVYYLNALQVERQKAALQTAQINALQANAGAERLADIEVMRKERAETIERLTLLKKEEEKTRASKYYLRRDAVAEPSINLPPQAPLIPQWEGVFPEAMSDDATQALSLKIILGLAVLGALVL
jgi:hypothetical protein